MECLFYLISDKFSPLTDEEWDTIQFLLPNPRGPITKLRDRRLVIDAILYKHSKNCPWQNLPPQYPPGRAVHQLFRRWKVSGIWDDILLALQRVREHEQGPTPPEQDKRYSNILIQQGETRYTYSGGDVSVSQVIRILEDVRSRSLAPGNTRQQAVE